MTKYYSMAQVAKLMGCTKLTLRFKMYHEKSINFEKVGGIVKFTHSELVRLGLIDGDN